MQPLGLIGKTPLVCWGKVENATIFIKDEGRNLTGSLKDRHAKAVLEGMEKRGELAGKELLDASSGSYAVALAMQAVLRGLPATLVVNEKISVENRTFIEGLKPFGITVINHGKVTRDGYEFCKELVRREPGRYAFTDQLNNPDIVKAHEQTANEILRDLPDVAAVVASVGSGATVLGLHNGFKGAGRDVPLYACVGISGDTGKFPGTYVDGADFETPFIREINERKLARYVAVRYDEGIAAVGKHLLPRGIFAGRQGGGVFIAAMQAVKEHRLQGNVVVVIGDSYWKNASGFSKKQ